MTRTVRDCARDDRCACEVCWKRGSERVTVPVKPLIGLTNMIEVAGVVPSVGTRLGRVVPTLKSGVGIESDVLGDAPRDSVACGASLG